jgi:hypothetical protein
MSALNVTFEENDTMLARQEMIRSELTRESHEV